MKKIIFFIALVAIMKVQAQNQQYTAIAVPEVFKDAKMNRFNLNGLLQQELKKKRFTVTTATAGEIPDAGNKNCSQLTAEARNTSSLLRNKVTVELFDCNGVRIAASEGKSLEKDFEPGLREALQKAVGLLPPVLEGPNAQKNPAATQQNVTVKQSPSPETEEKIWSSSAVINTGTKEKTAVQTSEMAQVYSNGIVRLNRIILSPQQFILMEQGKATPYAVFYATGRENVYRVEIDGNTTVGYFEGADIVIEKPNGAKFIKDVLRLQ